MSFVTAKREIVLVSSPPLPMLGKSRQRPMTSGQATGRPGSQERVSILAKSDKRRLENWGAQGAFFTEVLRKPRLKPQAEMFSGVSLLYSPSPATLRPARSTLRRGNRSTSAAPPSPGSSTATTRAAQPCASRRAASSPTDSAAAPAPSLAR